ncbi:MAG: GNAT family N-acetyltransferase [Clostridiales bacterium]|nr:GNAT family N-acetyltransferase [Clostridiales bacterium]
MTVKECIEIEYVKASIPDTENILKLYNDAGWIAYTTKPKELIKGISNSLTVYSAWSDNELVGFLRIIGDGVTIIYIQDVLVLKRFRRMGIGKKLVNMVLSDFNHVRQLVLLTDNNSNANSFYKSCGFTTADAAGCRAYLKLKGD